MSIRTILTYPNPLLSRISKPVQEFDASLSQLALDMIETMRESSGIGLAAPQVGELLRLIVVEVPQDEESQPPTYVVCNPEITEHAGETSIEEGCLSLPGFCTFVKRFEEVTIQGQNLDGSPFSLRAKGLLAICFQHEMDHLNGKLLVNYVSPMKRELYRDEVKKMKKPTLDSSKNSLPSL